MRVSAAIPRGRPPDTQGHLSQVPWQIHAKAPRVGQKIGTNTPTPGATWATYSRCCLFLDAKVRVIMVYWSHISTKIHTSLYGVLKFELSGANFLGLRLLSHCLFLSARRFECELTVWNWNLDVAFLKMRWTDSWNVETADYVQIPWVWPRGILPKTQKCSNAPRAGHAFATNPLLSPWVVLGSTPRDGRWYPHKVYSAIIGTIFLCLTSEILPWNRDKWDNQPQNT